MRRSAPSLFITVILFLVGLLIFLFVFFAIDHPPLGSWTNLTIAMGIFVVCFIWAFIRLLQWRDSRREQFIRTQATPLPPRPEVEGTVYGLTPGSEYRVVQTFTDYYGNSFHKDEVLRFQTRQFLPYHGGHTINFENRPLFLQEDQNKEILDHFSEYIIRIEE